MGLQVLAQGAEFNAPGVRDFFLPPILGDVTKPMVQIVLAAGIVIGFYLIATRNLKVVPNRFQFAAESLYNLGRDTIARDQIGSAEFRPFVPLIVGLFSFILVNNLFGIIPLIQFPTLSHIGFALAMSLFVVYPTYHFVGIRKHGLGRYMKKQLFPPGAPIAVYLILAPVEFLVKFVLNPFTLAVRVFVAMFAGHLLLLVFTLGGEFLLLEAEGALKAMSVFSWAFAILITFLEALVMLIQAYVFAVLTASYIGTALAEEH